MSAKLENQLKSLKTKYNEASNEKIRLTTRFDETKKRRKEASDLIKAQGYNVNDLPDVIKQKEKDLQALFASIEENLPSDEADDDDDY